MNKMRKRLTMSVLLVTICTTILAAAQRDTYYVVQQTNFLKDKGYKVYTKAEYKELQDQMSLEKRYFRQAIKEAKDKWDAEQEELAKSGNKKVLFPASAISPRTVMLKGTYNDKEKADEKLFKLEASEYEKLYGSGKKKSFGYKKPKKSEEDLLKDEQKRLMEVAAGKQFQKLYIDFIKEKTGKEAPVYIEHVELEKRH
jgi:hypothetical protein